MVKEDIIKLIREMPDDVTVDEILYRLYVRSQIEAGLEEAKAGKTIPHEEVKSRLEKWWR